MHRRCICNARTIIAIATHCTYAHLTQCIISAPITFCVCDLYNRGWYICIECEQRYQQNNSDFSEYKNCLLFYLFAKIWSIYIADWGITQISTSLRNTRFSHKYYLCRKLTRGNKNYLYFKCDNFILTRSMLFLILILKLKIWLLEIKRWTI